MSGFFVNFASSAGYFKKQCPPALIMENLSLHIIYLLSRHDCVILPGVGAFIVTRRNARYNETAGRWLPPTRHISFNAAVRNDDGLLAHSFRRRLNIDFEQARKELELTLTELLRSLRDGEPFHLGKIGTLHMEDTSRFIFTAGESPGRREGQLGLHAFSIRPVDRKTTGDTATPPSQTPAIKSDALNAPVRLVASSSLSTLTPDITTPAESTSHIDSINVSAQDPALDNRGSRKIFFGHFRAKTLRVAAACCAAVAIGVESLFIPRAISHDTQLASVVPVPSKIESTVSHTPSKAEVSLNTDTLRPREITPDDETSIRPVPTEKKFHLIVATFSSTEEAEKYISTGVGTASPHSLAIVPGRRVTRVAISSSDDRDELLTTMRSKDFSIRYPGAWIWEKE